MDAFHGNVVSTFAADREVVVLTLAVYVDREREIFARLEKVKFFLKNPRVRAHVYVLLASDQSGYDLRHLWVQKGFTAGDGDHRGAALFDSAEAFFRRQVLLKDVGRVLNLATSGTGQIAAEEWLQHQHQRI